MEKTKQEFVRFIKQAMSNNQSDAFIELYQFLVSCFVRADTDLDGKVLLNDFDSMITEAATLPRRYGFAPKEADMYPDDTIRKTARAQMFKQVDQNKDGAITLEEWVSFSVKHIMSKVPTLTRDILKGEHATKDEFIAFIKKAVQKDTEEYLELYHFLLSCFLEADKDRDGAVNHVEFDAMIDEAAEAPRRYGLAPQSHIMFKSDEDRLAKRGEYFKLMDINGDGTISFDEWLTYALNHIMAKVALL